MNRLLNAATLAAAMMMLTTAGCDRAEENTADHTHGEETPTPSNRIDINAAVRQNLGITFAKVERRNVARTLRVPGRFELIPTAVREYRLPVAGNVELLVGQYQRVEAGTPLYRIDSPAWRELKRQLTDAEAEIRLAQAAVDSIEPFKKAHEEHHVELDAAVALWAERVATLERLQQAGGAWAEDVSQAKASLATARAQLAETQEKEAELMAREGESRARLEASQSRAAILLDSAAWLTSRSVDDLTAVDNGRPHWQTISRVEVVAHAPGVIDELHAITGSFAEEGAHVLTTIQPEQVRFRARGLQSDLGRLADNLPATVVTPSGGSLGEMDRLHGTITLAPTADAERRTIELVMTPDVAGGNGDAPLPAWARAGVAAFIEVVVAGGGEELAIPLASIARDGTQSVIFRRDPADPNKAIRLEADLGIDDGRWIVINSGVAEGNEIVLDGVYQLMVATSGSIPKGGHFHADGTFHEGEH